MEDIALRRLKRWGKISGIIAGSLTTIMTPILVMYFEVKPDVEKTATEAKAGAETGYEAVVPAIVEIQDILNDAKQWAEDTDDEIQELTSFSQEAERRLARCEAYMEIISRRSNLPRPPAKPRPEPSADLSLDIANDAPVQRTSTYELPKSLDEAKAKQRRKAD